MLFPNVVQVIQGLQVTSTSISTAGTINYPSASYPSVSWLHTSGTYIYNSSGQVNLWGVTLQTGDQRTYTQADMNAIKSMGFNMIRIWIVWNWVEPSGPTVTSTTVFTSAPFQIDNMIQWAANAGLYVDLCVGSSASYPIPSWVPTGNISFGSGSISWTDSNTLTGIYNLYYFMANRYASDSNVIFEGLNEMNDANPSANAANFRSWNNNWVSAVEAGEGSYSHLCIIEFAVDYNAGDVTDYLGLYPPYISGTHSNVLMATHDYFLVDSGWSLATDDSWASQIHSACSAVNCPWIDTEFSTAEGGNNAELNIACQAMTKNGVSGWGYFCYDAVGGSDYPDAWCINNPSYEATLLGILQPFMT
jgi:hypothetical protein